MDSKTTSQSSLSSQVQKNEPTKEIVKKEETKPIKKFTPEEVKRIALDSALGHFRMDEKIRKLGEEILPANIAGKCSNEKVGEELGHISRALSLDSGHTLLESISENYQGLAFQMKQDLHREFDCKMASEKALVDLAVSSYISKLHYTKLLRLNQTNSSGDHTGYRNSASREIDRAHRQFISAIETLKIMKQPALKVNVKTNNAFIGEKQQFNNNQVQKDENNEAK
jgi:hypothetical protein